MTEKSYKKRSRSISQIKHIRPLKFWQDQSSEQDMRVEIVPLIDVIFCILTFFILAGVGLSRQQAISLDLPKASTGTPQMREMLVVSLDPLGQVYLDKQLVTRSQLKDALKNYHQLNQTGIMVLNAARNTSYNEVIQVLDLMRKVGGNRVALATVTGESENLDNSLTPPSPYLRNIQPNYSGNPLQQTTPGGSGNAFPRQTPNLPLGNPNQANPNSRETPRLP